MKTAIQFCLEKFMVEISNEDADKLINLEKEQIMSAFKDGKLEQYYGWDNQRESEDYYIDKFIKDKNKFVDILDENNNRNFPKFHPPT